MPQRDDDTFTTVKQYIGNAVAGAGPANPAATNPRRNYLYVENTGVNEGEMWFFDQSNSGQAIRIAPGDYREWASKCPIERFFLQSVLGTTFAIIEGMDTRRSLS